MDIIIQNLHVTLAGAQQEAAALIERAMSAGSAAPPSDGPPLRLGDVWLAQGGKWLGRMPGENGQPDYHLILPTAEIATLKGVAWGPAGKNVPGAASNNDGLANTLAMVDAGSALATRIRSLEIEGHKDFYLMSRNEARLAFIVAPGDFDTSVWYWTSTQSSDSFAWLQDFLGGLQSISGKSYEGWAVAVRRLVL